MTTRAAGHVSNRSAEAVNGTIELHCRVARGFRNRELPTTSTSPAAT